MSNEINTKFTTLHLGESVTLQVITVDQTKQYLVIPDSDFDLSKPVDLKGAKLIPLKRANDLTPE